MPLKTPCSAGPYSYLCERPTATLRTKTTCQTLLRSVDARPCVACVAKSLVPLFSLVGLCNQEIEQERATAGDAPPGPLLLQADNLERVLMARLLSPPDPSARPWQYLLASYGRVTQEQQLLSSVRDRDFAAKLGQTLTGLKQLLVSYSGLLLNMGMFPQVSFHPDSETVPFSAPHCDPHRHTAKPLSQS